ncbi:DUF427 domain-containing protein [Lysobacter korlensis]|uniref:DUF427 domain-containing protein n=1 Tax=Lysobacter korlensis TaxID=553636 RepID=A0ABV6RN25_9GAMM
MRAVWNGAVLAESNDTKVVEGNHYFPRESLEMRYFQPSQHTSHCFWKGKASYFHVAVDGDTNRDAAWFYPEPSQAAEEIRDHVAFWKGVEVH